MEAREPSTCICRASGAPARNEVICAQKRAARRRHVKCWSVVRRELLPEPGASESAQPIVHELSVESALDRRLDAAWSCARASDLLQPSQRVDEVEAIREEGSVLGYALVGEGRKSRGREAAGKQMMVVELSTPCSSETVDVARVVACIR
jgi:hypothetical protein